EAAVVSGEPRMIRSERLDRALEDLLLDRERALRLADALVDRRGLRERAKRLLRRLAIERRARLLEQRERALWIRLELPRDRPAIHKVEAVERRWPAEAVERGIGVLAVVARTIAVVEVLPRDLHQLDPRLGGHLVVTCRLGVECGAAEHGLRRRR